MQSSDGPLVCPSCSARYGESARVCPKCNVPLGFAGGDEYQPLSEAEGSARKVRPQFSRGEPVKVAWAPNQAEGELIQGLLLEEGIPSMQRRARGFDVPDFLAAGPRDILVPESAREEAIRMLEVVESNVLAPATQPAPLRLLAAILVIAMLGAGLAALIASLAA